MKNIEARFSNEHTIHSLLRGRLSRRIGTALLALSTATAATTVLDATAAHADGMEYTVINNDHGVYSRNSPHINDTKRIDGDGVYPGDKVDLICGVTNGDGVQYGNGPDDYNHTWHLVIKDGEKMWVSDHYLDTPANPNHLAPGESQCDGTSLNAQPVGESVGSAPVNPPTPHNVGSCKTDVGAAILGGATSGIDGMPWSQAWDGEWKNNNYEDVCVIAQLSDKSDTHGGQFLSKVAAASPDTDPGGCSTSFELEIWTKDTYEKTNCTDGMWNINKWVPYGNNICAAVSSAGDTVATLNQKDAEKAVAEGRAPLGDADPWRVVTCIKVEQ